MLRDGHEVRAARHELGPLGRRHGAPRVAGLEEGLVAGPDDLDVDGLGPVVEVAAAPRLLPPLAPQGRGARLALAAPGQQTGDGLVGLAVPLRLDRVVLVDVAVAVDDDDVLALVREHLLVLLARGRAPEGAALAPERVHVQRLQALGALRPRQEELEAVARRRGQEPRARAARRREGAVEVRGRVAQLGADAAERPRRAHVHGLERGLRAGRGLGGVAEAQHRAAPRQQHLDARPLLRRAAPLDRAVRRGGGVGLGRLAQALRRGREQDLGALLPTQLGQRVEVDGQREHLRRQPGVVLAVGVVVAAHGLRRRRQQHAAEGRVAEPRAREVVRARGLVLARVHEARAVGQGRRAVAEEGPQRGDEDARRQAVDAVEDEALAVDGRRNSGRVDPARRAVLVDVAALEQVPRRQVRVAEDDAAVVAARVREGPRERRLAAPSSPADEEVEPRAVVRDHGAQRVAPARGERRRAGVEPPARRLLRRELARRALAAPAVAEHGRLLVAGGEGRHEAPALARHGLEDGPRRRAVDEQRVVEAVVLAPRRAAPREPRAAVVVPERGLGRRVEDVEEVAQGTIRQPPRRRAAAAPEQGVVGVRAADRVARVEAER